MTSKEILTEVLTRLNPNYEYAIQGKYGKVYKWETVCSEATLVEAKLRYREYVENEPEYPHRIKLVRTINRGE